MRNQKGNALLILVAMVVVGIVGYLGYQYLSKGSKTPSTTTTSINLEESQKLPPAQVKITKSGFVPATVEIKAGQTVTFINEDTVSHKLLSDSKNPANSLSETDPIEPKEQMSFPFTSPGTIMYQNSTNPSLKGIIIVK